MKFPTSFCRIAGIIAVFILGVSSLSLGQDTMKVKKTKLPLIKDTLDGKPDLSHFLLDMKGFMPVPMIITEPALGGFGGLMAFTFLSPKKVEPKYGYVPPDITAVGGMYTANNSWVAGGGRMGSIPKVGIKYRAFAGFASLNLDFYRDISSAEDQKFSFNVEAAPVYLSVSKRISKSDIYLGTQYIYSKTKVNPLVEGDLPDYFPDKDLESKIASLGFFADWDKRNNFFTPDKGIRLNTVYSVDDDWTGSDYTYQKLTGFANWFIPIRPNWVSGLRLDAQHVFDQPPFYLLPFINLRGVPMARYQGFTTMLAETEQRYDFSKRWSGVVFAGMGKALMENQSWSDAELVYNYGAGFRYLVARAFGIRTGIDVAGGPGSFGWYIVFGHNWNR